jgi:hypothetical protein
MVNVHVCTVRHEDMTTVWKEYIGQLGCSISKWTGVGLNCTGIITFLKKSSEVQVQVVMTQALCLPFSLLHPLLEYISFLDSEHEADSCSRYSIQAQ